MAKQFDQAGALFDDPLRLGRESLRQSTVRTRLNFASEWYAKRMLSNNTDNS
jgi:hypothetical protein